MAKRKYKRLHYEDRQTIEAMSKPQSDACEHWRTCEMCNGVMGQCKKKQRIEKAR